MFHQKVLHCLGIGIFLALALCLAGPSHFPHAVGQDPKADAKPDVKTDTKKDNDGPFGGGGMLIPMMLIMAAFFFLIILPAQRREKKQREMVMSNLKKNDEIITHSGIIGVVLSIKENADEVTIKTEDSRLRILKSSIREIKSKDETPATPPSSTDVKPT